MGAGATAAVGSQFVIPSRVDGEGPHNRSDNYLPEVSGNRTPGGMHQVTPSMSGLDSRKVVIGCGVPRRLRGSG